MWEAVQMQWLIPLAIAGLTGGVAIVGVVSRAKIKDEIGHHDKNDTAHTVRFRHYQKEVDSVKTEVDECQLELAVLTERVSGKIDTVTEKLDFLIQQSNK